MIHKEEDPPRAIYDTSRESRKCFCFSFSRAFCHDSFSSDHCDVRAVDRETFYLAMDVPSKSSICAYPFKSILIQSCSATKPGLLAESMSESQVSRRLFGKHPPLTESRWTVDLVRRLSISHGSGKLGYEGHSDSKPFRRR